MRTSPARPLSELAKAAGRETGRDLQQASKTEATTPPKDQRAKDILDKTQNMTTTRCAQNQ
jgi:hypothetical protein